MVGRRILIEGDKVQDVGYTIFLLQRAYDNDITNFYVRNVDEGKVEVLVGDTEEKIKKFYETIKVEKPDFAINSKVGDLEPYESDISPIDRYYRRLTSEELYEGFKALVGLGGKIDDLQSSLGGKIDDLGTSLGGKIDKMTMSIENLPSRIAEAIRKVFK